MTVFLGSTSPVARVEHYCDLCNRIIMPGERYSRQCNIGDDGLYVFKGATTFCRCTRDDETLAQVAALVAEREAALADRLDARAARYRAAAGSAGSRADRLGLGRPFWSRAVGMESYYMKRAEHFRIAAAVIRETRGKP